MWEDPGPHSTHTGRLSQPDVMGRSVFLVKRDILPLASFGVIGRKQKTMTDCADINSRPRRRDYVTERLADTASVFSHQTPATSAACHVLLQDFFFFFTFYTPASDTSSVLASPLCSRCKTLVCTQTVTLNNRPASRKCQAFKSHTEQCCVPERECFITA